MASRLLEMSLEEIIIEEEIIASDTYPAAAESHGELATMCAATSRIKVENIPLDLDHEDVHKAFEVEAGRVVACEMEGSRAWFTFERHRDAEKAVSKFDGGELNGARIRVKFVADSGLTRSSSSDSRPAAAEHTWKTAEGVTSRVQVENIANYLDLYDIMEAFKKEGRIVACKKKGSRAWFTFQRQIDAQKAVRTFHLGELNGKTITVKFVADVPMEFFRPSSSQSRPPKAGRSWKMAGGCKADERQGWLKGVKLLQYKRVNGKDFYHVKWKGYSETTWQPADTPGLGLSQMKEDSEDESGGRGAKEGDSKKRKRDGDDEPGSCDGPHPQEVHDRLRCIVCCDAEKEVAFRCGHLVACEPCSRHLRKCPVCRKSKSKRRIYIP